MNVIFLDFDGVLNNYIVYDQSGKRVTRHLNSQEDMRLNNSRAIEYINKLCLEFDLGIVVTSSWRLSNDKYPVDQILYNSGLDYSIKVFGITEKIGNNRGYEVGKYILDNDIKEYIIIDDDSDLGLFSSNLIKCESFFGFTEAEYIQAKEFLSKKILDKKIHM